LIGVFFGGYAIEQQAFIAWDTGALTGTLFPFLFVTIACGACSGFHGLVCSGTTSKQIARESHCRPVGYGAMLAEAFVALIALVTVIIVSNEDLRGLGPGTIYGNGIGRFLTLLIGEENLAFAVTFGAMAFSTFVFDTLDVATRLGRYLGQELLGWTGRAGALGATLAMVAIPAYVVLFAPGGSWVHFWTLFGASNQLLAALTLISLTVWLRKSGRRWVFAALPAVFVLGITVWALSVLFIGQARASAGVDVAAVNAASAFALLGLAGFVVVVGVRTMTPGRATPLPPAAPPTSRET